MGERGANFLNQFVHRGGRLQQVAQDARQCRRGGFAAGDDERPEGGFDLQDAHALFIVVAAHIRHEIVPLLVFAFFFLRQPTMDLRVRRLRVAFPFLDGAFREHGFQDSVEAEEAEGHGQRREFELREDDGDPAVVAGFFEITEGGAEGEVADDVEGCEIEPLDHVDG